MKHNRSIVLSLMLLLTFASHANDESIKKMKADRDQIAEIKEEICKGFTASRSECLKNYISTVKVQDAPELVLLSVATTDMYARDRMQWEEKEVPFRFMQLENWFAAIDRIDAQKFIKTEDQQAITRAKQKLMGKAREELAILYGILSSAKGPEIDQQKQKYRDLLQQYQKVLDQKLIFPKS